MCSCFQTITKVIIMKIFIMKIFIKILFKFYCEDNFRAYDAMLVILI